MSEYYILSGMDEKNDYNFYKEIGNLFRKELSDFKTIVYISAYPKDTKKNIELAKSERFSRIGINFKNSIVLDYSITKKEAQEIIKKNDLVFLYGGDPYQQMKFMQEYELINLLRDKVLITLSAGSINICKDAICTKDKDFSFTSKYKRYGIYQFYCWATF